MKFSEQTWGRIAPIYGAILDHPFIQELSAGSLSRERFQFYMIQDALYLADFSAALALIADRTPDPDIATQFRESARNALAVEGVLHETFLREFGTSGDKTTVEASSTCFAYTNYLLATAQRSPVEVAVAAVLPCFWIYWEVGKHIRAGAAPANPYQRWIDTYGDEVFGSRVRHAISIADGMADAAAPTDRDAMLAAFYRASQLEWMFWDSAYRRETWPV
ncbi:MAG: thiaminase II [Rhodospirillaceae bacterium]|jgi:thiaminase (transcriptional activator TenA)|nr:thiaminase II [Rhodospirillaceae bacterium]MBT4488410.1 thiaminase II [Rhodospirillaceae bacterium]MBT5191837.1 thiaminase II [Rhodospirillaceae bacterium]MBT5898863.1 thiaminase II [Rhodospirillaceae bacterium]MBT6428121.1 thiaminase II [Rhodospirillaceae bacterium]